jgi:hypothetical protein
VTRGRRVASLKSLEGRILSKLDIEQRPEGGVCGKMRCWTTAPIWSLAKPLQDPGLNIHAPECIKPGCELTSLFLFRTVLEISTNKLVYGIV